MSEELLRIDDLPKLADLRFLLMEVLGGGKTVTWYDLVSTCRSYSFDLGFSFENGVKLLKEVSAVETYPDQSVRSRLGRVEQRELTDDHAFCRWMTKALIKTLEKGGLLATFFNLDTVKFDMQLDSISININLIPLSYPMMKVYLQKMEIADPDWNINSRIIIKRDYKKFFIDEVLKKVFSGLTTLDIVIEQGSGSQAGTAKKAPVKGSNVFISYAREDEVFRDELKKHLSGLINSEMIKVWYDGMIRAGEEWDARIKQNLEEADIVLFIVTADLMDSNYINKVEIQRAIERHLQKQIRIIPIIARPCDHKSLPISQFQALPKGGLPIVSWLDRDEAYLDIVNQLRDLLTRS